ncbi:hypothetical protein ACFFNY_22305 [Paenibacillus hodogayensis]|uniref:Lipoprotein n=1 Tax=Paenibacillus hodogayensis TaxID=279208 RepID=A0ABV5W1M1_9BACL
MDGENGKARKLVSLFVAAALIAAPGCGSSRTVSARDCWDRNNDGYCDDDGSSVGGGSYHYVNGSRVYTRSGVSDSSHESSYKSSSGISTGSKGGIGSSSGSSSS